MTIIKAIIITRNDIISTFSNDNDNDDNVHHSEIIDTKNNRQ